MQVLGDFWRKATMTIHGRNVQSVDIIITAGLLLKPGNTSSYCRDHRPLNKKEKNWFLRSQLVGPSSKPGMAFIHFLHKS